MGAFISHHLTTGPVQTEPPLHPVADSCAKGQGNEKLRTDSTGVHAKGVHVTSLQVPTELNAMVRANSMGGREGALCSEGRV